MKDNNFLTALKWPQPLGMPPGAAQAHPVVERFFARSAVFPWPPPDTYFVRTGAFHLLLDRALPPPLELLKRPSAAPILYCPALPSAVRARLKMRVLAGWYPRLVGRNCSQLGGGIMSIMLGSAL